MSWEVRIGVVVYVHLCLNSQTRDFFSGILKAYSHWPDTTRYDTIKNLEHLENVIAIHIATIRDDTILHDTIRFVKLEKSPTLS